MSENEQKMLSIWFFVSMVVGGFGVIILGVGLVHAINPPEATTVLAELNPNLWWGIVMCAFAAALFVADRMGSKE